MIDLIFYLPTVLLIASGLPQTYRLLTRKSSTDISISMYTLTLVGIGLITIDAYRHQINSILVSNSASFLVTAFNLWLVIYYRLFKQK